MLFANALHQGQPFPDAPELASGKVKQLFLFAGSIPAPASRSRFRFLRFSDFAN
jgi:hypothetical protein